MCKMEKLNDLVDLSSGFQFRGAIKPDPVGDVLAVQMSNVDANSSIPWEDLVAVFLPSGSRPRFLQEGDVLFTARGQRNVAVVCEGIPADASIVASQHFFLMRLCVDHVLPAFLAWQINQGPFQAQLSVISEGAAQKAIPLRELKSLSVAAPTLEEQHAIINLHGRVRCQQAALQALIENRNQLLFGIAQDLSMKAQHQGAI